MKTMFEEKKKDNKQEGLQYCVSSFIEEAIEAYIKYAEKVSELSDEDVKKKINYYVLIVIKIY